MKDKRAIKSELEEVIGYLHGKCIDFELESTKGRFSGMKWIGPEDQIRIPKVPPYEVVVSRPIGKKWLNVTCRKHYIEGDGTESSELVKDSQISGFDAIIKYLAWNPYLEED